MSDARVVEICAGAGGQSLGLHLAGFRHQLAVELDPGAAATLRHNLARLQPGDDVDELVAVGDVADPRVWTPEEHVGVDLLAGGVPCPPFSIAGKQLGATDERDLFAWAVELAGRIRPRALLLENVRGLGASRFSGYRQAVIDRLDQLGYSADWQLLEARDYGVPQLRPRFVLVAFREEDAGHFEWPEPKPTSATVGTALYDLMAGNGWAGADEWADRADGIAPTIVGGSKKHGGADLGPTRAKRSWAALGVDAHGVADSAPADDAPRNYVPRLTCRMVERLQGWAGPEYEWEFLGRKTSHYRQVGNAFPPPVARAVGSAIADALTGGSTPSRKSNHVLQMQDEVYRVLQDRDWITLGKISKLLGGRMTVDQILKRLVLLEQDFVLERSVRGGRAAFRLGDFKAFRGQNDHDRHLAFANHGTRSRIS